MLIVNHKLGCESVTDHGTSELSRIYRSKSTSSTSSIVVSDITESTAGVDLAEDTNCRVRYTYKLGLEMIDPELRKQTQIVSVCQQAFQEVYGVSDYILKIIQKSIKCNSVPETDKRYGDNTAHSSTMKNNILKSSLPCIPVVTEKEAIQITVSNDVVTKTATAWMEMFFDLIGDKIPNSNGEIHLEPQEKKTIWEEYRSDVMNLLLEETSICYSAFCSLWEEAFPHVSIRVFKAVGGKCNTCAILADLRKRFHSAYVRDIVTELHALHRITYMSERQVYYAKIWKSVNFPQQYWSTIFDGMAQNHTQLPYLSHQKDVTYSFDMHLQGGFSIT